MKHKEDIKVEYREAITGNHLLCQHPSFGCMNVMWQTASHGMHFFGSDVLHNNTFSLQLETTSVEVSTSTQRLRGGHRFLELHLTDLSFYSLMKNTTCGEPVPVNIHYMPHSKEILDLPEINEPICVAEIVKNAVLTAFSEKKKSLDKLIDEIEQYLDGSLHLTPKQVKEKTRSIEIYTQHLYSNVEYEISRWKAYFEKQESTAKTEIEAVIQHKIFMTGVQAINENPELLRIQAK